MANWYDDAVQMVKDSTSHPRTRDEVISYFKNKYPGVKMLKTGEKRYEWKEKLTDMLQSTATDSKGQPYKRASIARRFQKDTKTGKDRYESTKPSKKQQTEYKDVGALLPGKPPKNGYHVSYKGGVRFSECEYVSFELDITGEYAEELAKHPDRLEDIVMRIYLEDEESGIGTCDLEGGPDNELTVHPNADDYAIPTRQYKGKSAHKYHKPFFK